MKGSALHAVGSTWLQRSGDFANTAKSMCQQEHTESISISISTKKQTSGRKLNLQTRKVAHKLKDVMMSVTLATISAVQREQATMNLIMKQSQVLIYAKI